MLNGRDHPGARKHLVVNGHGKQALAEPDTSALYGEYEQRLATELAELLKSGSAARSKATSAAGTQRSLPRDPAELYGAVEQSRAALPATALQEAAPGRQRTFVPAARLSNDFTETDADDDLPLAFSWRHEPRPPQPSWVARQARAGLLGLCAGLIVVLPAVAVLSGRLDAWLPALRKSDQPARVAERPFQNARLPSAPLPVTLPPAELVVAPPAAAEAEPAQPTRPAAPTVQEAAKAEPAATAVPVTRSLTVEAFPPAAATALPSSKSRAGEARADVAPPAPATTVAAASALPAKAPARPIDEAKALLSAGLKLVKEGDIAGARDPLAKAANIGDPEAMLALGETFDPNMLAAWGAVDVKSDASSARLFYGRALAAGLTRAKLRLNALN